MVIPGCETSGISGMEVHFSHILRTVSGSFVSASGGGFWSIHTRRVRLSLPQFRILYRWCLLRALCCAASTSAQSGGHFSDDSLSSVPSLTTLIRLCGQAFHLSLHTPGEFLHGRTPPPPLVACQMDAFAGS